MNRTARYSVIFLSLSLIFETWGCAGSTRYYYSPQHHPSEEARAKIGIIGVALASNQPETQFHGGIGKGGGASYGALQGMDFIAQAGAGAGEGAIIAVALLPVGALIGAIYGADKGLPKKEKEKADVALAQAITELMGQETMREHLVEAGRRQTDYSFVMLEGQDVPETTDIDTVLEISVKSFGLQGEGVNPPLVFFFDVQTRLAWAADSEEIQCDTFQYHSLVRRSYTEWAADDARHFREEFERGFELLAERIVDVLFLIYTPEKSSTS